MPHRTVAEANGVAQLAVEQLGESFDFIVRRLDRRQEIGHHLDHDVADRVDVDAGSEPTGASLRRRGEALCLAPRPSSSSLIWFTRSSSARKRNWVS